MKFEELPAAMIGKLGEIAASEVMQADGASMIALCRIDNGGAPMIERGPVRGKLILPDFQAFNWKGCPLCFMEIKTYAESRLNKTNSCMVHGIPVRQYNHYCANENDTKVPVYLGVNELDTGELRITEHPLSQLDKLACQCRGGCHSEQASKHIPSGKGIKEMQWYFNRDDFSIVYKHSDKTIDRLRRAHSKLFRPGHVYDRHGSDRTPRAPTVESHRCRNCGIPIVGCIFTVGSLDGGGDRVVMCGTCWRSGAQAAPLTPSDRPVA